MKIRNGFVSNSSSTSFTFCLKEASFDALYDKIRKHGDSFKLSYDRSRGRDPDWAICNADSVIKEIQEYVATQDKRQDWEHIKFIKTYDYIDEMTRVIKSEEKWLKENEDENLSCINLYEETIIEYKAIVARLNRALRRGLKNVVIIGFGDNHGQICGCHVGLAMDYEGRKIEIEESDFFVFTKQNR